MEDSSMKYLGAATDDGEYWNDRSSKANDLGPGVSFTVRVAEDGGHGPHLICCYGLREDVNLPAVIAEAERIIAAYQIEDPARYPNGRKLQGQLHLPTLAMWPALEDVLQTIRESRSICQYKKANLRAGGMVWSIESIIYACTGAGAMVQRVIESAGLDKIQAIYDEVSIN